MKDCSKCPDREWCSGEELDSEACPVRSGPGLSVSIVGFTFEGVKYKWYDLGSIFLSDLGSEFGFFNSVPVGAYDLEFN